MGYLGMLVLVVTLGLFLLLLNYELPRTEGKWAHSLCYCMSVCFQRRTFLRTAGLS